MHIKSIQLENYLGLVEGTGRGEISVDFQPMIEAGLKRCLLLGRNGVGKSTLLNALTPFPDQGDERSVQIVPGRPGRKIIVFDRNGTEIKCDIRWTPKGKASCFMFVDGSKDPLPLTAKGNIGEYLRAVQEELGVTPDYLKMGRVGSRVSGFLDLGPSQRKGFIGKFMPEIEEWQAMHKNVAKRVSAIKAQLQGMQTELERIEPRDDLEASLARADADLLRLRGELSRIDNRLGEARGAIGEMTPARNDIVARAGIPACDEPFNPIADVAEANARSAAALARQVSALLEQRPLLQRFAEPGAAQAKIVEIRDVIARAQGELAARVQARSGSRGRLDAAIRTEETARRNLQKADGSSGQLEALRLQADELVGRVADLATEADGLPGAPDGLTYDEVKQATDALMGLEAEVAELRAAFASPSVLDAAVRVGMDDGALTALAARAQGTAREHRQRLDTARARIATIEAQAQFHNRFAGMQCRDAKCPFESHVGQFATAAAELEENRSRIAGLEERASAAEAESRELAAARQAARAVLQAHGRLRRYRPTFEAAGVWDSVGPQEAFLELVASASTDAADTLSVTRLLRALAVKRDLTEANRTLETVRSRIEGIEGMQAAREQYREALVAAEEATTAARAELVQFEEAAEVCQKVVTSQNAALALLQQLDDAQRKGAEAAARASLLGLYSDELERLRGRWETAHGELLAASADREAVALSLRGVETAHSTATLKLGRRDEFEARVAETSGTLARAQAVADACHPAKGAPVEFLRDFLDVTRDTVNDLLDVALRGEFRLGFSLTESEFRIPVSKGSGRTIPDVTEASEGQIALAKTVLSLALVKQTVMGTGMNIIYLDEVDGALDKEKNRERFAEIVDKLTTELRLEQLFLISHNENFYSSPSAMILLPGHAMPLDDRSFVGDKLILANFE